MQLRNDEFIDRPFTADDGWNSRLRHRLKRPMHFPSIPRLHGHTFRPGQTKLHPTGERHHHLRPQRAAGRHLQIPFTANGLHEPAFFHVPRHCRRAAVAPFQDRVPGIEPEAAFLFLRSVTGEAVCRQERPDLLFKKIQLLGREALSRVRTLGQARSQERGKNQHGGGYSLSHGSILLWRRGQFRSQP